MAIRIGSSLRVRARPSYPWEDNPPGVVTRPARIATGIFSRSGAATQSITTSGWTGLNVDNYVTGFVQNVNWSELQSSAGGTLITPNPIDTGLAIAQARGLQVKVRLFTGSAAPASIKAIGGTARTFYDTVDALPDGSPSPYTMARHWHLTVQDAVDDLMSKLADAYGTNTTIVDFSIAGPMTKYAEPMVKQLSVAGNRTDLLADGYTYDKDVEAFSRFIKAHKVFRTFTSSLACNPYQHLRADGTWYTDEPFTEFVMAQAHEILGNFACIGNNSLRDPPKDSARYAQMYTAITARRTAKYFQTATQSKVGNLYNTCQTAFTYGASMIEMPGSTTQYLNSGSATGLSPAQVTTINAALTANAAATMAAW